MDSRFEREELLIGLEKVNRLAKAKVLLFGVGGVGGYTAECLARAGVGHITLVDSDKVDITNINRQILALNSTIGKYKVDVCKERILDINPECEVITKQLFYLPGTSAKSSQSSSSIFPGQVTNSISMNTITSPTASTRSLRRSTSSAAPRNAERQSSARWEQRASSIRLLSKQPTYPSPNTVRLQK